MISYESPIVCVLKKLKTTVRKSAELQGPTKTKKITVTDFKKETNKKPEVLNNNKEILNNNNLVPYEGVVNEKKDYKTLTTLEEVYYNPWKEDIEINGTDGN